MKITKITNNGERIHVWTDLDPNTGFGFNTDDIADKTDLLNKLKLRVQEHMTKKQAEQDRETKYQNLKTLKGTKI